MFHRLSKHIEFRQKYSAARRIFNSLLGVWISWWNTVSRVWYITLLRWISFSQSAGNQFVDHRIPNSKSLLDYRELAQKTFSLNKIEIPAGGKFMNCSLLAICIFSLLARKIWSLLVLAEINKRTVRVLANASKGHSISLVERHIFPGWKSAKFVNNLHTHTSHPKSIGTEMNYNYR